MDGMILVGHPDEFKSAPNNTHSYKIVDLTAIEEEKDPEKKSKTSSRRKALVLKIGEEFHAVDAFCPHQGYPLSQGKIVDIEDFGICFGKAIKCPAHFWTFSLDTGRCDRSPHELKRYKCILNSEGKVMMSTEPENS